MISINQTIHDITGLSLKAQMVISWIPGAKSWFDFALNETQINYTFESEVSLLNSILSGLYSDTTFLLKNTGITASPERFLSLSQEQLSTLDKYQKKNFAKNEKQSSKSLSTQFQQFKKDENIYCESDYESIDNFFSQYKLSNKQLPFSLELCDKINFCKLIERISTSTYSNSTVQSAFEFSLNNAVNGSAFICYFEFALVALSKLLNEASTGKVEKTNSNNANSSLAQTFQELKLAAMKILSCPQLSQFDSANDVVKIINSWANEGNVIGFTDLPSAILGLSSAVPIETTYDNVDLEKSINNFKQSTCTFLSTATVSQQYMSQDAKTWHYILQGKKQCATISLSEDGCISLNRIN